MTFFICFNYIYSIPQVELIYSQDVSVFKYWSKVDHFGRHDILSFDVTGLLRKVTSMEEGTVNS